MHRWRRSESLVGLIILVVLAVPMSLQVIEEGLQRLWYIVLCLVLFVASTSLIWRGWNRSKSSMTPSFGLANQVTFVRLLISILLAALVPFAETLNTSHEEVFRVRSYTLMIIATINLLLDGLDGYLARRTQTSSAFGARFDMEVDATFILVLCALLWQLEVAPAWILAIGLMRYAFVGAAILLPALNAPLTPSLRRKTICVIQVLSLVVCLHPQLDSQLALIILMTALTLLAGSFFRDAWVLLSTPARHRAPS